MTRNTGRTQGTHLARSMDAQPLLAAHSIAKYSLKNLGLIVCKIFSPTHRERRNNNNRHTHTHQKTRATWQDHQANPPLLVLHQEPK
jgi:hypothetical protein